MEQNTTANGEKNKYENQMIEAFINNSETSAWYQKTFKKYQVNGVDKIAWNWNWWAFLGGPFFLFYRKAYLAGLVLLLFTIVWRVTMPPSPFILIVPILAGGLSTYFVYREYKKKKAEIERTVDDTQKRLETMLVTGGYDIRAIWVYAAIVSVSIMFITFAVIEDKPIGSTHNIEYSDYSQVRTGMSYREVVSIIGVEGAEISSFNMYDIENTIYQWKNSNGSNITLTFQNGRLTTKIQFGLNRR